MPLDITATKEPRNNQQKNSNADNPRNISQIIDRGNTEYPPVQCILDRTNTEYNKLTILVGESLS